MKTLEIKKYTIVLAGLLFLLVPAVALAQNLVVDFEEDPLFDEANFLPGNEVTRTVGVTNNTGETQNVIVEAINALDDDGLGDDLDLVIKEGATTLYVDTLGEFLRTGEVSLSALGSSNSTTYSFGVTFKGDADNDTQATNLGFDLCVGFEGGDTHCGGTVVGDEGDTGGGGGGGGGGVSGSRASLEVFNEEVTEENTISATAVIEWDSNLLATSQVIYGKQSLGPYTLNLGTVPYFGYPFGTVEDTNKVKHHVVVLTGLDIGEVYVYRVVSRSSPPTVGFEQTFVLAESDGPAGPSTPPPGGTVPSSSTGGTGDTGGGATTSSPEVLGAQKDLAEDDTQGAAAVLLALPNDFSGWLECLGLFLIFVVLIYIAWALWRNSTDRDYTKSELSKRRNLFFFVGSLISIFIAYLLDWDCAIIPLAILAVISLVLYLWDLFTNRDR